MPSGEGTKQAISSWILKSQLQVQLVRKVGGCSKENRILHNRAPVLYDYDFRLASPPFSSCPSLSSPATMLFVLGLLLAPTLGFFFSHPTYICSRPSIIPREEGDICNANSEDLLLPRHKKSSGYFPGSENVQNCLCPSISTEGWLWKPCRNLGCFSQPEGSRQQGNHCYLCVFLFRESCVSFSFR